MDADNELEEFVVTIKEISNSDDDMGRARIKDSDIYKRLSEKFDNLDELIDAIYNKADLKEHIREHLRDEWEDLRLNRILTGIDRKYLADSLCFRISLHPKEEYQRFNFRYGIDEMKKMAIRIIDEHPFDIGEYNENYQKKKEQSKDYQRRAKYNTKGTESTWPTSGSSPPAYTKKRLRDRLELSDD